MNIQSHRRYGQGRCRLQRESHSSLGFAGKRMILDDSTETVNRVWAGRRREMQGIPQLNDHLRLKKPVMVSIGIRSAKRSSTWRIQYLSILRCLLYMANQSNICRSFPKPPLHREDSSLSIIHPGQFTIAFFVPSLS